MNARLKVLQQKANVKPIKLQPSTVVGRSAECDLRITSGLVSRVHCRITVNDDTVLVEDLGSANGTFVDGESLSPHQPKMVNPGSKLVIGPVEFVVEYVTSTSNTIVIRRSSDGARPAVEDLKQASSLSDSELLLASPGLAFDDDGSSPAQAKSRPPAAMTKPAEPARPVAQAPVAPKPVVPAKPVITIRPPEAVTPKPAVKPAVNPVAALPPVAKVVSTSSTPTDETITPRRADTVQPQPSPIIKQAAMPPAPAKRPPVAPPAPQAIEFAEAVESNDAEEQTIQFQFGDAPDDALSAKSGPKADKTKPMKSLFSMFGGKQKSGKPDTSEPTLVEEQIQPAAIVPEPSTEDAGQNLMFGETAPTEEESSSNDNPQMDDDFQNFLKQF